MNNTGRLYTTTSFMHGGRRAGMGMLHDDYGDESGNCNYEKRSPVRFPHDDVDPEEMNGPVIIVKKGNGKEEERK